MGQYLLSTYEVEGEVPGAPQSPEEMQAFMERVVALEDEMEKTGTFVFGGALHGPDASTVLRAGETDVIMTDGPFVETKVPCRLTIGVRRVLAKSDVCGTPARNQAP